MDDSTGYWGPVYEGAHLKYCAGGNNHLIREESTRGTKGMMLSKGTTRKEWKEGGDGGMV